MVAGLLAPWTGGRCGVLRSSATTARPVRACRGAPEGLVGLSSARASRGGPGDRRSRDRRVCGFAPQLAVGFTHAREWPSGEVAVEDALDLVADRSRAAGRRAPAPVRTVVVPVVNPDGFVRRASGRGGRRAARRGRPEPQLRGVVGR